MPEVECEAKPRRRGGSLDEGEEQQLREGFPPVRPGPQISLPGKQLSLILGEKLRQHSLGQGTPCSPGTVYDLSLHL